MVWSAFESARWRRWLAVELSGSTDRRISVSTGIRWRWVTCARVSSQPRVTWGQSSGVASSHAIVANPLADVPC